MTIQQEVEVILARQLFDYLALPIFLVDPDGNLLFYNEPAEGILGHRYAETGPMPAAEWATIFDPTDEAGQPLPPEALPLITALRERRPAHSEFWIRGLDDGVPRRIEVTAFPLVGQAERRLGAVAIFWEKPQ
jgi:PAS domain-containing protein